MLTRTSFIIVLFCLQHHIILPVLTQGLISSFLEFAAINAPPETFEDRNNLPDSVFPSDIFSGDVSTPVNSLSMNLNITKVNVFQSSSNTAPIHTTVASILSSLNGNFVSQNGIAGISKLFNKSSDINHAFTTNTSEIEHTTKNALENPAMNWFKESLTSTLNSENQNQSLLVMPLTDIKEKEVLSPHRPQPGMTNVTNGKTDTIPKSWMQIFPDGNTRNNHIANALLISDPLPRSSQYELLAQHSLNTFGSSIELVKALRNEAKQQRQEQQLQKQQEKQGLRQENIASNPPGTVILSNGPQGEAVARMVLPGTNTNFIGKQQVGRGRRMVRSCVRIRRILGKC